jgi:hypothetical protein
MLARSRQAKSRLRRPSRNDPGGSGVRRPWLGPRPVRSCRGRQTLADCRQVRRPLVRWSLSHCEPKRLNRWPKAYSSGIDGSESVRADYRAVTQYQPILYPHVSCGLQSTLGPMLPPLHLPRNAYPIIMIPILLHSSRQLTYYC